MQKLVKKILDLLPFDGSKLKIAGWWTLFTALPQLIPGLDWKMVLQMILENPTKSGIIAAVLAALHKVLKLKFPES